MAMHGRRVFLGRAVAAGLLIGCGADRGGNASAQTCARTEPNIEGPFFLPDAPVRRSLRTPEDAGPTISFSGRIRTSACGPARNAVLEIWHADEEGGYDLRGFRHRATLRADARGRYAFDTIEPGRYLNGPRYRPAHVHVKVHADGVETLTTQLYFHGDPHNDSDPWIRDSLIVRPRRDRQGQLAATFDFVL